MRFAGSLNNFLQFDLIFFPIRTVLSILFESLGFFIDFPILPWLQFVCIVDPTFGP